jgi:hypothetical protein
MENKSNNRSGYFENDLNTLYKLNQFSDQQQLSMCMRMINIKKLSEYNDSLDRC